MRFKPLNHPEEEPKFNLEAGLANVKNIKLPYKWYQGDFELIEVSTQETDAEPDRGRKGRVLVSPEVYQTLRVRDPHGYPRNQNAVGAVVGALTAEYLFRLPWGKIYTLPVIYHVLVKPRCRKNADKASWQLTQIYSDLRAKAVGESFRY